MENDLKFKNHINGLEYISEKFNLCGCVEFGDVLKTILDLLQWLNTSAITRVDYDKLYGGDTGAFYLLVSKFEELGLAKHGNSIRCGWITEKGETLLKHLSEVDENTIKTFEDNTYTYI